MGFFENIGNAIFGTGSKVKEPYESAWAKLMKGDLYNLAKQAQNNYDPNKQLNVDIGKGFELPQNKTYDTSAYKSNNNAALADYKNMFGDYKNTMSGILNGQLSQEYSDKLGSIRDSNLKLAQDQIGQAANEKVGGLLGNLAGRGVINSSVMSDGTSQIGKSAANAIANAASTENANYNSGYLNALNQTANNAGSLLNNAGNMFGNSLTANNANLQGDMTGQQYEKNDQQKLIDRYGFNQQYNSNTLKDLMSKLGFEQNYNNQAFQNAYNPMMQLYGIEQERKPLVEQGTQGLLETFMNNLAGGLGSMIPRMGGMI